MPRPRVPGRIDDGPVVFSEVLIPLSSHRDVTKVRGL